jgi:ADP-ribosylglycohydrolase
MPPTELNLRSRFRGTVLGAAVADALAFPYQHYSRRFLRSLVEPLTQEFAEHASSFHPRGQYTDETQTLLATIHSVVELGAVNAEAMAGWLITLWRDQLLVDPEPTTTRALELLAKGKVAAGQAGLEPGVAEAHPAARAVAVALWDFADFERLCTDVEISTRLTHRDPRCAASSAAVAAAVASNIESEEIILGQFLDRTAAAAGRFDAVLGEAILDFPRVLSLSEDRALRHFESLCPDDRYPPSTDGIGSYCVPVTLTALYYFLKSPYLYEGAVEGCLRIGGSIGTAAFLAGAMSGSLLGEDEIPKRLLSTLFNAGEIGAAAVEIASKWWERKEGGG